MFTSNVAVQYENNFTEVPFKVINTETISFSIQEKGYTYPTEFMLIKWPILNINDDHCYVVKLDKNKKYQITEAKFTSAKDLLQFNTPNLRNIDPIWK